MQVTELSAEGLKREYKVVVQADEIEGRVTKRLDELRQTDPDAGLPPGQGAGLAAAQAVRPLGDGRGARAGGQPGLAEGDQRPRAAPGAAAEDRGHLVRRGRRPRVHDGGRGPARGAGGRPQGDRADPPERRGRRRGAIGQALDNLARRVQEFAAPAEPPRPSRGRRPADHRLRGHDRRRAVRGRQGGGLAAGAGLGLHDPGLREPAPRSQRRRRGHGRGDLPAPTSPRPSSPARPRASRSGSRSCRSPSRSSSTTSWPRARASTTSPR